MHRILSNLMDSYCTSIMQQQFDLLLLTFFVLVLIFLPKLLQRLYQKLYRRKTCTVNSKNPEMKLNHLEVSSIADVRDPSYLLEYDPEVDYRPPPKID